MHRSFQLIYVVLVLTPVLWEKMSVNPQTLKIDYVEEKKTSMLLLVLLP